MVAFRAGRWKALVLGAQETMALRQLSRDGSRTAAGWQQDGEGVGSEALLRPGSPVIDMSWSLLLSLRR